MFYEIFKYKIGSFQSILNNKPLRTIILLLSFCGAFSINVSATQTLSAKVDSLVSTFPYLINDSADVGFKNVELALALNVENKSLKVDAYGNYCLGMYYKKKGNNRTALRYQHKAFDFYTELKSPDRQALVLNELGIIHKNLGEYDLAIQSYVQGIEICEEHELTRKADFYTNLGIVYTILDNNDLGLTYLFKSLELEEDAIGREVILLDIGTTYNDMNQDSLAMVYYKMALKLCDENDLPRNNRNDVLHNIADALIENGAYEEGLAYLFENDKYNEAENNLRDLVYTKLSIAAAYQKMNQVDKAHFYIKRCIELGHETESMEELIKAYKIQSELYKQEHLYKKSLDAFEAYDALKDSLFNIEKTKYTEILIADFEADRKENEILLLKKEKLLQENELLIKQQAIRSNKIIRNITIGVAALLLMGAYLLIFFYQQKIRDGELLAIKAEEVNKQKTYEILRDQEFLAIKAGISGREKERKRIAQELHDGIGGNLASIKLNLTNTLDEKSDKRLQQIIKNIDDTCKEVRAISHNLISFEIKNHAFTYIVEKFINELSEGENLKTNLNLYPAHKLNELSNDIKIELYRIVQELMNNVIKHAQASQVDIQIIERDETVNLMVEDNGIGYETKTSTHGIGLKNIRARVKALNGNFSIESSLGNWTLANIEIPVNEVKTQA